MILRVLRIVVVAVVVLIGTGVVYQVTASRSDRQTYLPPGQLVDAGGHKLHLQVMGEGGPTVILEAGAGSVAAQWGWVQPEVAKYTRVVAYDRAGLGWSEPSEQPNDGAHAVEQLHTALQNAGIEGPYVYVGHSLGGHYARLFADRYPDEVIGVVLLDASHPEQFERISGLDAPNGRFEQVVGHLTRLGIVRIADPTRFFAGDLPVEQRQIVKAFFATPQHWSTASAETAAMTRTAEQVQETNGLGDRPLVVVSAGVADIGDEPPDDWHRLQRELAEISTRNSHWIVDDADHFTLVTNPDHAQVTVEAVREIINLAESSAGAVIQP